MVIENTGYSNGIRFMHSHCIYKREGGRNGQGMFFRWLNVLDVLTPSPPSSSYDGIMRWRLIISC